MNGRISKLIHRVGVKKSLNPRGVRLLKTAWNLVPRNQRAKARENLVAILAMPQKAQ